MQRVGIIGANGLLGSDLASFLKTKYEITGISRDNYETHKGKSFDILINANGNSKRFWANQHVLEDFTASTISVYKTIFDFKFKKYIYISSSDVYEDHSGIGSTSEDQAINSDSLSSYGFHKFLSEKIVTNNVKDYLILRSSMILGKNLKKGPIFDIINDKELFISLDSRLQMITTRTVASILDFLISNKVSNQVFNMGGRGVVDFKNISEFFTQNVECSEKAEKQVYEMNVDKLHSIYSLDTSKAYLKSFLKSV